MQGDVTSWRLKSYTDTFRVAIRCSKVLLLDKYVHVGYSSEELYGTVVRSVGLIFYFVV